MLSIKKYLKFLIIFVTLSLW